MLADLKKVQDQLYSNQSIQAFLNGHPVHELIKTLNKTNKGQTKIRIKRFFYKLEDSEYYKEYLLEGLQEQGERKSEFAKYINSENSEEYYELLQKKQMDLLSLMESNHQVTPMLFSLVYPNGGIKMIKLFADLYSNYSNHDCLYTQQVQEQLQKGVKCEDTVVQMRFVEIVANIAIQGGKSFQFVQGILEQSLNIYNTEDILLKLNIVEIVSILGKGAETSQLLRGHKIWKSVERDAMDEQQQFYVRKMLLILLVEMNNQGQYEMTEKLSKKIIEFLRECFSGQGQYLEAGVELSGYLCCSNEGIKILARNNEVFGMFLKLSRSTQQNIKNQYILALTMLTDKTNGKKTKNMVINVLNCIGNPNISAEFTQHLSSNNLMTMGIEPFCKWFAGYLSLPFEDLELKLIDLFQNLLGYPEICESLFEEQSVTKFLLKPVNASNSQKVLRGKKNQLVHTIIEKGEKEWKGTKLEAYSVMIEKELEREKMDVEVATEAQ